VKTVSNRLTHIYECEHRGCSRSTHRITDYTLVVMERWDHNLRMKVRSNLWPPRPAFGVVMVEETDEDGKVSSRPTLMCQQHCYEHIKAQNEAGLWAPRVAARCLRQTQIPDGGRGRLPNRAHPFNVIAGPQGYNRANKPIFACDRSKFTALDPHIRVVGSPGRDGEPRQLPGLVICMTHELEEGNRDEDGNLLENEVDHLFFEPTLLSRAEFDKYMAERIADGWLVPYIPAGRLALQDRRETTTRDDRRPAPRRARPTAPAPAPVAAAPAA